VSGWLARYRRGEERFDISSNYGFTTIDGQPAVGRLEVGFDGTCIVPAPLTLLLGLVGVGCAVVARLRRRGR
jgi:hypothetical protein